MFLKLKLNEDDLEYDAENLLINLSKRNDFLFLTGKLVIKLSELKCLIPYLPNNSNSLFPIISKNMLKYVKTDRTLRRIIIDFHIQ